MTTQPRKILVTCALPFMQMGYSFRPYVRTHSSRYWVRFQRMRGNKIHFVCADDAQRHTNHA